ncbi:MAG: family 43 glycosylhydrolase, partial [Lentisphaeria bacterium]
MSTKNKTIPDDLYCNPLPLPDLGRGYFGSVKNKIDDRKFMGEPRDFREVADPEALWYNNAWYVYPSIRQAYVSYNKTDWTYQPIDIEYPLGYAPTITKIRDRFLLTSCIPYGQSAVRLFEGATPLGPFKCLGTPHDIHGKEFQYFVDPALFTDDNGRLYLFWGCAPVGKGIYGVELDADNPLQAISDIVTLIKFDSNNPWEHYGEYGEHPQYGWDEGASMFKHNGEYYLQYSACGTGFRHYSLACYRSKESPLGPFTAPSAPMLITPHGIVTGTGHGGMTQGPDGSIWQFYTCLIRRVHDVERRIGMDRVSFDTTGEPHITATSVPQSISRGELGWLPVSVNKFIKASSWMDGLYGNYAVDDCPHTCWAPLPEDKKPQLMVDLVEEFSVCAARIIWTEMNLDYDKGLIP